MENSLTRPSTKEYTCNNFILGGLFLSWFLSFIFSFFSSGAFLASFVTVSNSFLKPLSAKEEKEELLKLSLGDEKARNKLIEHNLRLVAHIAKKYTLKGYDNDDIISIGTIGLIKGVSSFKMDKGVNLATYVSRCIENEILMTIRQGKKTLNEVLLQDSVGKDKDGKEVALIDKLQNDDESVFDEVNLKLRIKELYMQIKNTLNDRERKIIALRYGIFGKDSLTQKEISKILGISRSYVSRIEKKALKKLMNAMSYES